MSRTIALISLACLLLIAGALASIPFLVRDPVPVARPGAPISLGLKDGPGAFSAQLLVDRAGRFTIVLGLRSGEEPPPTPRLFLDMPHHEMTPVEPEVRRLEDGRFSAAGAIIMPGRWTLKVDLDGDRHAFDFIVAEY